MKVYDVIVLGSGPAGLNAALYAYRYGLSVKIIGKDMGLITKTNEVENYLGIYPISGFELVQRFTKHINDLGIEVEIAEISKIEKDKNGFSVEVQDGIKKYKTKTVICALGGHKKLLGHKKEKQYSGKGLAYCTTCDAPFFKNKNVAVLGGSNSAVQAAMHLSKFAKKVTIIYRRGKLRAVNSLTNHLKKIKNIDYIFNSNVVDLHGDNKIEAVTIEDNKGKQSKIELDGVFVEFGYEPNVGLAKNLGVKLKDKLIDVKNDMSTNVPCFFAAGDCTNAHNKFFQVVMSIAEGALAARSVHEYLIGK